MKPETIKAPFESDFGIINVGDAVAFVTSNSYSVNMRHGTYLGYIESGRTKRVQVEYEYLQGTHYLKGTDTEWDYREHGNYNSAKIDIRTTPVKRRSCLQLNRVMPIAQKPVAPDNLLYVQGLSEPLDAIADVLDEQNQPYYAEAVRTASNVVSKYLQLVS